MTEETTSALKQNSLPNDPVAGKTLAEILGEIAWLMTQDPAHKGASIGLLESHVMPGIILRQFHIQYARVPAPGGGEPALQPVAVEIWAMVSDEVMARLERDSAVPLNIAGWRSGEKKRVMLLAALPGASWSKRGGVIWFIFVNDLSF